MKIMMQGLIAAAVMMGVASASPAYASVEIAQNTSSDFNSSGYQGQSFLAPGSGSYNSIVFSLQSNAGTNVGAGNLYLFDKAYAGTVDALSSTTSGALGAAAYNGSNFTFNPLLSLTAGTEYYAYYNTSISSVGLSGTNPYSGGQDYYAGCNVCSFFGISSEDLRFNVTGTAVAGTVVAAVPESSTWAMMILGMGAIGFALRSAMLRSDEKFTAKIRAGADGAFA